MNSKSKNPLTILAVVAAVSLSQDLYRVFAAGYMDWWVVQRVVLLSPFLIFYLRRQRIAWLTCLIGECAFFPVRFVYFSVFSPVRLPPSEVMWTTLLVWLFCTGYTLYVRQDYYAYLTQLRKASATRERGI